MSVEDLRTGTWITIQHGKPSSVSVRRSRIEVVAGPDAGLVKEFDTPTIRVGARAGVDLLLSDSKVSGFHLEILVDEDGYRLRDLLSTNGTYIKGLRVRDVYLAPRTRFKIGLSELRFVPLTSAREIALWPDDNYQQLIGRSVVMRRLFATIERISASDATVLITGETGTGKELVADAIHQVSPRAQGPFVVLDCSAIPASLFENELFGHEKGAFTGAERTRPGAFERAHGGTLFLDEIGELPPAMQPKLLRAVESRAIRRVGGSETINCDVRLLAATNRNLAVEVNRGGFRDDLYYRIAVACVDLTPLRERKQDIPILVDHFLDQLPGGRDVDLGPDFVAELEAHHWPGNVRELRNAVERAVLLPNFPEPPPAPPAAFANIDVDVPFKLAKKQFVDGFERCYVGTLMERCNWNISAAARAAGVDRMSIYKLINRLGISNPK